MSWYGQHPGRTKADVLASGAAPPRACRATLYRARCGYQISGTCSGCSRDQGTRLRLWRERHRGQRGRFVLRGLEVEWLADGDCAVPGCRNLARVGARYCDCH